MTISERSYIERILIVLNPDGSLKGVHSETLHEVRNGEAVLAARQDVAPLDPATLAHILPDHAALVAQVQALGSALETLEQERDALLVRVAAVESRVVLL